MLFSLLSGLPGMLGTFFTQKAQLAQAQLATNLAIEQAKLNLAEEIAKDQLEESKVVIGATSPWFKYCTFAMWFWPFIIGSLHPSTAAFLFQNLAQMPQWYVTSCMTIMFTIWGISVASPVVSDMFTNLGQFFANSRQAKIELKKVDKQAFFDAIRHLKGSVSAADMSTFNPVLDQMEKDAE